MRKKQWKSNNCASSLPIARTLPILFLLIGCHRMGNVDHPPHGRNRMGNDNGNEMRMDGRGMHDGEMHGMQYDGERRARAGESGQAQLFRTRCGGCHTISGPAETAPSLRVIYQKYRAAYPARETFVFAISKYAHSPSPGASLMPEAIRQFGLMPPQTAPASEREEIAGWIWDSMQ